MVTQRLADIARKAASPDLTAIGAGAWRLTYGDLDGQADRIAAAFSERGFKVGERVVLLIPSSPDFVSAFLGCQRAGLVTVAINPLVGQGEFSRILSAATPRAIIAPRPGAAPFPAIQHLADLRDAHAAQALIVYVDASQQEVEKLAANCATFSALQHANSPVPSLARDIDDEAAIFFTSGTSGQSKGVSISEGALIHAAAAIVEHLRFSSDDLILTALPFSHIFGQAAALLAGLLAGAQIEVVPRPAPELVLEAMEKSSPTYLLAVPTTIAALAKIGAADPARARMAAGRLRLVASGGAAITTSTAEAFAEHFGVPVIQGYGMTEAAGAIAFPDIDASFRTDVGRVLPVFGYRIEPMDPSEPNRGELQLSGKNLFRGYYVDGVLELRGPDDWFSTGDMVEVDAEGRLTIFDRKKELIIRGGYNVYPSEVEEVLASHPAVLIAAVTGAPHEELGQEIAAFVVLQPGATAEAGELIGWRRQRLSLNKYPRVVKIVEDLPLTPTGKVLKRALPIPDLNASNR